MLVPLVARFFVEDDNCSRANFTTATMNNIYSKMICDEKKKNTTSNSNFSNFLQPDPNPNPCP